jgi:hypothetical protein
MPTFQSTATISTGEDNPEDIPEESPELDYTPENPEFGGDEQNQPEAAEDDNTDKQDVFFLFLSLFLFLFLFLSLSLFFLSLSLSLFSLSLSLSLFLSFSLSLSLSLSPFIVIKNILLLS